ncbi:MAG: hypothetical protein U5N85_11225 [Arcicella sp.]|nr:hypothetical protein [Arcicella sp.]
MLLHYSRLSEKERRHYASLEVIKLGYGSKSYIQNLFKIGPNTLKRGILDFTDLAIYQQIPLGKQRRVGGGRKKNLQAMSD